MTDCASELAALRLKVASLEARLAQLDLAGGQGRQLADARQPVAATCKYTTHSRSNLVELLPSLPGANLKKFDGRCSRRYVKLEAAWQACERDPVCVGVVRDNGLACGGPLSPYELRGGGLHRGSGTAWVCEERLQHTAREGHSVVAPTAPPGASSAREGFSFIVLGACAMPNYDCLFVREVRDAVAALRAVFVGAQRRPIAVISDGGIPARALMEHVQPDLVTTIPQAVLTQSSFTTVNDLRVRALARRPMAPLPRAAWIRRSRAARTAGAQAARLPPPAL